MRMKMVKIVVGFVKDGWNIILFMNLNKMNKI